MFDRDGKFVRKFKCCLPVHASSLAVDSAGNWIVCGSEDGPYPGESVQVLDPEGKFVTHFAVSVGRKAIGIERGQVRCPASVCVDNDGRIWIGDRGCVHVFAFALDREPGNGSGDNPENYSFGTLVDCSIMAC